MAANMVAFTADTQFCAVLAEGQLRVWEAAAGTVKVSRAENLADPVTCAAWDATVLKRDKKKRRSGVAIPEASSPHVLAIGTMEGNVHVLDMTTAETTHLTAAKHGGRVTSVAWHPSQQSLYTAGEDGHVLVWATGGADGASLQHRWAAEKRGVSAIAHVATPGEKEFLVTAASKIRVWSLDTYTELAKFSGHAMAVSMLLPLTSPRGAFIASAVLNHPDDLLINVWAIADAPASAKKPAAAFQTASSPSAVVATATPQDEHVLLVVDQQGRVLVYVREAEADALPADPVASIAITTGDVPTRAVPILSAAPVPGKAATHCVIAHGRPFAPTFEIVEFAPGGQPTQVQLTRSAPDAVLLGSSGPATAGGASAASKTEVVTLGPADSVKPPGKRKKTASASGEEPTLGERARELGVAPSEAETQTAVARPKGAPTASSMVHWLTQALQSKDKALLEECLSSSSEEVVKSTVARLPPHLVVVFLKDIVEKFEAKPSRGLALLGWIRAILLHHSAYLMSVPDLPGILAGLYSLVDARLSVYPRLLKLNGRLELMFGRMAVRSAASAGPEDDSLLIVPETSYVEQDSDDEAAAAMDLDDDVFDDEVEEDEDGEEASDGDDDDDDNDLDDDDDEDEEDEEDTKRSRGANGHAARGDESDGSMDEDDD